MHPLAIAALLHDLPKAFKQAGDLDFNIDAQLLAYLEFVHPAFDRIIDQAERYATTGETYKDVITNQPLRSIFPNVQLQARSDNAPRYYPLKPLPATAEGQDVIFCQAEKDGSGYGDLLKQLGEALNALVDKLSLDDHPRVYHHLLALLERFAWSLPCHTTDISLYDHAKLTSAIAVCLHAYHQADLTSEAVQAGADQERFCLIVGDVSGIQDYIFDIANIGAGGVARRLRARSFYISALSDVISHLVADQFDVPLGNIIMASGGKFYVLVPKLGNTEETLHALRREIDRWFRKEFNGELSLNMAQICFQGDRFKKGGQKEQGFGFVLTSLSGLLNREKQRRGYSVLVEDGDWVEDQFMTKPDFWGAEICRSCRKLPGDERDDLCEQCARDEDLGKNLPGIRYLAYYRQSIAAEDALPMPKGYSARVFAQDELDQVGDPYLLIQLNDPNVDDLIAYPAGFRYLANHVPLGDYGAQKTFEDIANEADGRSLLGYIKADVDYLGILFAQGLRRDDGGYDTAAHLATLSRQLDLFFSGWIQATISRKDYQNFYTIFSGGDDLFLVGPWSQAAELAQTINERFRDYVGGNPDITLSAGILFTKNRYPIYRAAADAEEVLERSKDGRNQLTILGNTFGWDQAAKIFDQVATLKSKSKMIKSSFLYHLIEYGRLHRKWKDDKDVVGLRYKPLFAYNIARNLRKGDKALYQWADELMQSIHSDEDSFTMQYLGLIATYVLFARRERN